MIINSIFDISINIRQSNYLFDPKNGVFWEKNISNIKNNTRRRIRRF